MLGGFESQLGGFESQVGQAVAYARAGHGLFSGRWPRQASRAAVLQRLWTIREFADRRGPQAAAFRDPHSAGGTTAQITHPWVARQTAQPLVSGHEKLMSVDTLKRGVDRGAWVGEQC